MPAIPLLRGLTADSTATFRSSWQVNYEPVITETGISKGYLRATPGIRTLSSAGLGADRGGHIWNGVHYRVLGSKLVTVSGSSVTVLGDVGNDTKPARLDNSFDLLGIASGLNLYYWDGGTLTQVTDPDLGPVVDMMYLDGRFITTDGSSIVLTELNDPYSVDPLKYGSAEVSPDAIVGLCRLHGEMYAIGGETIENFRNVGGAGFPYQRNSGAFVPKGATGTNAFCYFLETFAFVGCGEVDAPSVWLMGGGQAINISTPDVDRELLAAGTLALTSLVVESRQDEGEQRLLIHLPDKTLVYLRQASIQAGESVWCQLNGGLANDQPYPLRNITLAPEGWVGGDALGRLGVLDDTIETNFGVERGWRIDTLLLYNEARGGIINSLELIGLTGRAPFGSIPKAFLSFTMDGQTYSQERAIETGRFGELEKRVQWRPGKRFANYCGIRLRGVGNGRHSWARLEAEIEGLAA